MTIDRAGHQVAPTHRPSIDRVVRPDSSVVRTLSACSISTVCDQSPNDDMHSFDYPLRMGVPDCQRSGRVVGTKLRQPVMQ